MAFNRRKSTGVSIVSSTSSFAPSSPALVSNADDFPLLSDPGAEAPLRRFTEKDGVEVVEAVAFGLTSAYSYSSPYDVPRTILFVDPSVPRSLCSTQHVT